VEEYANPSQPIFYMFLSMFYKPIVYIPIVYIDAWTHGSFIFSFTVEGEEKIRREGRKKGRARGDGGKEGGQEQQRRPQ